MASSENDQFDILEFLATGPKIIKEFRESKSFYVEEYGRGVYPRSLLKMLEDLELVKRFKPYKSTDEEIEEFSKELEGVSKERKNILEQYVSWRLTEFGKETVKDSNEMAVEEEIISSNEEDNIEEPEEIIKEEKREEIKEIEPISKTVDKKEMPTSNTQSEIKNIEEKQPETKIEHEVPQLDEEELIPEEQEKDEEKIKEEEKQIQKSVEQSIDEMKIVEERDESEIIEEEIANKKNKITKLNEEYDNLGMFDRSRKKEIKNLVSNLEKEIKQLQKKI